MTKNIVKENFLVEKKDRREHKKHHSFVLWFTGLSGSGKSTISKNLEIELLKKNLHSYSLDGDNVRHGLNKDLGFSAEDRTENIRRIAEVAKLMVDAGLIVNVSFISPYIKDRELAKSIVEENEFIEVFVDCPIEECEKRDIKGLYKKARAGEIKGFTGIDDPYEKPQNPQITLETDKYSINECVNQIIKYLEDKNYI